MERSGDMTTSTESAADPALLIDVCKRIRRHIVTMTHAAQSGHPGGSLSATEIFAALYFGGVVRHDPSEPQWKQRDRVILSKGHATPVVYATLAEAGYFDEALIPTFRSMGTELQGHVVRNRPAGVEMSGGALGMGLSFAVGVALGHQLDGLADDEGHVFVVVGDGELNEGQNWEAIMSASHFGLQRITAVLDRNHYQNDGPGNEIMRIDPVGEKWTAFGWGVQHVDGHDVIAVRDALLKARERRDAPQVVICETVKGQGVSFMAENPSGWHGKGPSDAQLEQALMEIEAGL